MNRREFLQTSALAAQATPARPNLILITNDQHRADSLGCMANPVIRTPNLDRLANDGVLFTKHFVQAPQCVPSRVSIATGRYPHTHRTPSNAFLLPDDEQTMARLLNNAGYRTAAVGERPFAPQNYTGGFSTIVASGRDHAEHLRRNGWAGPAVSSDRRALLDEHARLSKQLFQASPVPWPVELDETTFFADRACQFLREAGSAPYFLHMNLRRPHHPFDPPKPYDTKYAGAKFPPSFKRDGEMANKPPQQLQALRSSVGFDLTTMTGADLDRVKSYYYGMIELADHAIGQVLNEVEKQGMTDNTVVVFCSDHGEMLGDHGLLFKGAYMYDQVVHSPLIIRAPGRIAARSRVDRLVESIDILPTVLDLLGIEAPEGIQGTHLLKGRSKQAVFSEFPTIKMARTTDWKLVHYPGARHGELYDLQNDPHELVNLWGDAAYASRRAEMTGLLADWLVRSEDAKRAPKRGGL